MENKIIEFKGKKPIKSNTLKAEYEEPPSIVDDMYYILEAFKTGSIKDLDMIFEFDGQILYYGPNKQPFNSDLRTDLFNKVRDLKARASIE